MYCGPCIHAQAESHCLTHDCILYIYKINSCVRQWQEYAHRKKWNIMLGTTNKWHYYLLLLKLSVLTPIREQSPGLHGPCPIKHTVTAISPLTMVQTSLVGAASHALLCPNALRLPQYLFHVEIWFPQNSCARHIHKMLAYQNESGLQ